MKGSLKRYILFLGCGLLGWSAIGQDTQYSQFYAAPMYLNPAFAGSTPGHRASLIYRNQWPSLPGQFVSFSAAFDQNLPNINSGIGMTFHRDRAGSGGLTYTNVGAVYGYAIRVNRTLAIKPALGLSYSFRSVDLSKLEFGDQLITGANASINGSQVQENVGFVDVSTGVLAYGTNFWAGYSQFHVNRPNTSLLDGNESRSPRHSLHGGYRLILESDLKGEVVYQSITFAAQYKSERQWDQFDIGGYFTYLPFLAGVWYRGLPGFKGLNNSDPNNESIIVTAGLEWKRIRFAYSYDITVSRLFGNTGGAHELSLVYSYHKPRKRKRRLLRPPCPTF